MLSDEHFHPSQAVTSVDTSQWAPQPSESITVTQDGPIQVTIEGEGSTILERVWNCADQEDLVIRALKELNTGKGLCHEEWQERDSLVLPREGLHPSQGPTQTCHCECPS